jgi:thiol-disulfide isomerase/thioredoxin
MVGVWVLAAALVVAVGVGVMLRARDGAFRESGKAGRLTGSPTVDPVGAAAVAPEPVRAEPVAAASVLAEPGGPASAPDRLGIDPADLGAPLGEQATLVQFSSAFCAPCRATRVVLTEVARLVPGVSHIEVDAENRLELTRRLGVLRTPTVLVLDASGREIRRASGAPPSRAAVLGALEAAGVTGGDVRSSSNTERRTSPDQ